jgi:hypothetical protein
VSEPNATVANVAQAHSGPDARGTSGPVQTAVSMFTPELNISDLVKASKAAQAETEGNSAEAIEGNPKEPAEGEKTKGEKPNPAAAPVVEVKVEDLQKLAKDGKIEDVLRKLGIDPDGLNIPANRFAEFRQMEKIERRKTDVARQQLAKDRSEVDSLIAKTLADHDGFAKARASYEKGDVLSALKHAFGDDFDRVVERAIKQQAGKDPELIALQRREELRDKQDQERQEAAKRAAFERAQSANVARYLEQVGAELVDSEDALIAKAASRPQFINAVYQAQLIRFQQTGVEISPDDAAKQVIKTIQEAHLGWSEVFGSSGGDLKSPVSTDRAGKKPSITDPAGISPAKGARKGVSASRANVTPQKAPEEMSESELMDHFKALMAAETE